jgi:CheY-like chemotaxis protein
VNLRPRPGRNPIAQSIIDRIEGRRLGAGEQGPTGRLLALVAGGDARVRRGIAGLVEAGGRFRVVASVSTACEAAGVDDAVHPDLVIVDLDGPADGAWLELTARLRAVGSAAAIVAVGAETTQGARALAAGADAFVTNDDAAEALGEAFGQPDPTDRPASDRTSHPTDAAPEGRPGPEPTSNEGDRS